MHTPQRSSDSAANIGLDIGVPCPHFVQMFRSRIGTDRPFAAPQRFGLLCEGLLPCRQRCRQANS